MRQAFWNSPSGNDAQQNEKAAMSTSDDPVVLMNSYYIQHSGHFHNGVGAKVDQLSGALRRAGKLFITA